jgi:hypothetical protein
MVRLLAGYTKNPQEPDIRFLGRKTGEAGRLDLVRHGLAGVAIAGEGAGKAYSAERERIATVLVRRATDRTLPTRAVFITVPAVD